MIKICVIRDIVMYLLRYVLYHTTIGMCTGTVRFTRIICIMVMINKGVYDSIMDNLSDEIRTMIIRYQTCRLTHLSLPWSF